MRDYKMKEAENVLLTGCSAGGLSTFLHVDYVGSVLKREAHGLKKYRAVPLSGYFLLHENVEGKMVYPDEMRYSFHMQNISGPGAVNDACVAAQARKEDAWRCYFANETFPHIQTPLYT